jgi:hypothetical protein
LCSRRWTQAKPQICSRLIIDFELNHAALAFNLSNRILPLQRMMPMLGPSFGWRSWSSTAVEVKIHLAGELRLKILDFELDHHETT